MKNPFNPARIYIIKLANDCWYVGLSNDLSTRLKRHFCRKAKHPIPWLNDNKPMDLSRVLFDGSHAMEREVTLDLIKLYGLNKVRGANFTRNAGYPEGYAKGVIENHKAVWIKEFL